MMACRYYQEPCVGIGSIRRCLCDPTCPGPVERKRIRNKSRGELFFKSMGDSRSNFKRRAKRGI